MTPQRRRDNSPFRPNAPPLPVGPEYYDRALELVNYFRMQGNAPFVEMGRVPAAQRHADDCLAMGMSSQWNLDGLKPYMRYSLAGGYQATSVFSWSRPEPAGITDLELMIEEGVTWLFETMGNRRIVLDAMHRRVNIGIAWNQWHFVLVVELEGNYVEFDGLPDINNGILAFAGRVKNGVRLQSHADLSADVWYDPLPRPPTVGQLLRVNAYDLGTVVANLRPPPPAGQYWPEDWGAMTIERHAAPEDFAPDSPVPSNPEEIQALLQEAYHRGERPPPDSGILSQDYWRPLGRVFRWVCRGRGHWRRLAGIRRGGVLADVVGALGGAGRSGEHSKVRHVRQLEHSRPRGNRIMIRGKAVVPACAGTSNL